MPFSRVNSWTGSCWAAATAAKTDNASKVVKRNGRSPRGNHVIVTDEVLDVCAKILSQGGKHGAAGNLVERVDTLFGAVVQVARKLKGAFESPFQALDGGLHLLHS